MEKTNRKPVSERVERLKSSLEEAGVAVACVFEAQLQLKPQPDWSEQSDERPAALVSIGVWNSVQADTIHANGQTLVDLLFVFGTSRIFVSCPFADRAFFVDEVELVQAIVTGRRAYAKHGAIVSSREIVSRGMAHKHAIVTGESSMTTFSNFKRARRAASYAKGNP